MKVYTAKKKYQHNYPHWTMLVRTENDIVLHLRKFKVHLNPSYVYFRLVC